MLRLRIRIRRNNLPAYGKCDASTITKAITEISTFYGNPGQLEAGWRENKWAFVRHKFWFDLFTSTVWYIRTKIRLPADTSSSTPWRCCSVYKVLQPATWHRQFSTACSRLSTYLLPHLKFLQKANSLVTTPSISSVYHRICWGFLASIFLVYLHTHSDQSQHCPPAA